MSINNNGQINNRKEFQNNFSIYRNNFFISNSKNDSNYSPNNKIDENIIEPIESLIFQKKINQQKYENGNLIKSNSMIDIKPNFNKKKKDFYINDNFKANPNVEEIPTFSYENDLNVNSFRSYMNKKRDILKKNYEIFMKYMKKHENEERKKQLISPYSLYVKKINDVKKSEKQFLPQIKLREIPNIKLKINRYENPNNININNKNNSFTTSSKKKSEHFELDKYLEKIARNKEIINNKDIEIEKNIENKMKDEKENNKENILPISNSVNDNKKYFPKKNEISNPELFYKKKNNNFYKYRKEYKKFDDYNYKIILLHNKNRFIKKEPDINPYNPQINLYKIGNSSLSQNIILRPGENYGNFNKKSFLN